MLDVLTAQQVRRLRGITEAILSRLDAAGAMTATYRRYGTDPGPAETRPGRCQCRWSCQSGGSRPAGPGTGWSAGWCWGGASGGPAKVWPSR